MHPIPALSLSLLTVGLMAGSPSALAQTGKAEPIEHVAKLSPANKAASPPSRHSKSDAQARTDAGESLTPQQIALGSRVLTGTAQCEFNQSVSVDPMLDKPGHFRVAFKKATYTMTPRETTTGAVRLEDQRNGIVWLQIPAKSMMMNHKAGQRMVDGCMHAEQRAAAAAVKAAAR